MQQSAAQIMHGEKQGIRYHIELIWGGFRLYPLGREVQIINCAVNVANDRDWQGSKRVPPSIREFWQGHLRTVCAHHEV